MLVTMIEVAHAMKCRGNPSTFVRKPHYSVGERRTRIDASERSGEEYHTKVPRVEAKLF